MKQFKKLATSRVSLLMLVAVMWMTMWASANNEPPVSHFVSGYLIVLDKITGNFILDITSVGPIGSGHYYKKIEIGVTHYLFENLAVPENYTISAYRDSNNNDVMDAWEQQGSIWIYMIADLFSQVIPMTSVHSDTDGIPDWWEFEYGLDRNDDTDGSEDLDEGIGDGLTNLEEYENGTNPNLRDTDGDGLFDGLDVGLTESVSANGSGGVLIRIPNKGYYHATDPDLNLVYLGVE